MEYVCGNCIYYRGDGKDGFCYLSEALTFFNHEACTAYSEEETNG